MFVEPAKMFPRHNPPADWFPFASFCPPSLFIKSGRNNFKLVDVVLYLPNSNLLFLQIITSGVKKEPNGKDKVVLFKSTLVLLKL